MNTDRLEHKETTEIILKSFYEVYNELGDGFLESVSENKRKKISDNQCKSAA
jgi:capsid portal protein